MIQLVFKDFYAKLVVERDGFPRLRKNVGGIGVDFHQYSQLGRTLSIAIVFGALVQLGRAS